MKTNDTNADTIPPHGGTLINREATGDLGQKLGGERVQLGQVPHPEPRKSLLDLLAVQRE